MDVPPGRHAAWRTGYRGVEGFDAAQFALAPIPVVEANWKIVIENYQECYHCSVIHPELCKVSPPMSGDNFDPDGAWLGGSMTGRCRWTGGATG